MKRYEIVTADRHVWIVFADSFGEAMDHMLSISSAPLWSIVHATTVDYPN